MVDFAKMHSGVLEPNKRGINPYSIGLGIWEDIDRRSKGLPHVEKKVLRNWRDEEVSQKLDFGVNFVRSNVASDAAFFKEFLTNYLVDDLDLYRYGEKGDYLVVTDTGKVNPATVRDTLVNMHDQPQIKIVPGGLDYNGRGELYLRHEFDGRQIRRDWTEKTLMGAHHLWRAPVMLETVFDDKKVLLVTQDGQTVEAKNL